jgi:hypothetical protein
MRLTYSILAVIFMASTLVNAQNDPKVFDGKQREIGMNFTGLLTSYGATYKFGTKDRMFRINGGVGDFVFSDLSEQQGNMESMSILNLNLSAGVEWRKSIMPRLELRYGADIFGLYDYRKDRFADIGNLTDAFNQTNRYTLGLNGVFGFNYIFYDALILGMELLPAISYTSESIVNSSSLGETSERISSINANVRTEAFRFSLSYRF